MDSSASGARVWMTTRCKPTILYWTRVLFFLHPNINHVVCVNAALPWYILAKDNNSWSIFNSVGLYFCWICFFYTCELCYIYLVMAKDRPEKPAKGIKRKNGEKVISPKKRVNSGTTSGTTVGKNPGKNGVKSARKLAPHTEKKISGQSHNA